jgi:hypothetical protein
LSITICASTSGLPDLSRLVEGQQVGRARRIVYADLTNSVQKITLP